MKTSCGVVARFGSAGRPLCRGSMDCYWSITNRRLPAKSGHHPFAARSSIADGQKPAVVARASGHRIELPATSIGELSHLEFLHVILRVGGE